MEATLGTPTCRVCRDEACATAVRYCAALRSVITVQSDMGLTILAGIAILQGILTLVDGMRAARHIRTFRPRRLSSECVMVFCPCKGTDSEFEKNIQSILSQDYSNFEVQLIVESEDD